MFWCFNLYNEQRNSRQESFDGNFKFVHKKKEVWKMDNFSVLKNWPKWILKDMAVYALTFHCICCHFETVFITILKIRG